MFLVPFPSSFQKLRDKARNVPRPPADIDS
jgi:hypothetical protein